MALRFTIFAVLEAKKEIPDKSGMCSYGFLFPWLREHRVLAIGLVAMTAAISSYVPAYGQQRLISIGERRLSINCGGQRTDDTTVVLMPGGGEPASDWSKVQPKVAP